MFKRGFMNFFGQSSIKNTLSSTLSNINNKTSVCFLFVGDSGSGKTHIAHEFLASISGNFSIQNVADNRSNEIKWDSVMDSLRGHLIDEVHLANNTPMLYEKIDSKKYIICLCTTDYGGLHKSLLTRCILLRLVPYTDFEIKQIILDYSNRQKLSLTIEAGKYIASLSRNNPRVAKSLVDLLRLNIPSGNMDYSLNDYETIFSKSGVYRDGYTDFDIMYLDVLRNSGGIASLSTMANTVNLDIDYIVKYIEPFLIKNGDIQITRKGRQLCK